MMHTSMRSPTLSDTPDVTCPSDFPDSERRTEDRGILPRSDARRWLVSIYKEIENFLQNIAIKDADPS